MKLESLKSSKFRKNVLDNKSLKSITGGACTGGGSYLNLVQADGGSNVRLEYIEYDADDGATIVGPIRKSYSGCFAYTPSIRDAVNS